MHSEMGSERKNPIRRTVRTAHLSGCLPSKYRWIYDACAVIECCIGALATADLSTERV